MTLSIGNKVRKVQDDGTTPVPNEGHVLFEVIGTGTIFERQNDGTTRSVAVATLKALE